MISAEYDYDFLVTRELTDLVNVFIDRVKQDWPNAIVLSDSIEEGHEHIAIFRDKDMEQRWDWQVSTDSDFSGEGLVTLQVSPWGFQEMELLVKKHNTKSSDGIEVEENYDTTLISSDLSVVSLVLPWDKEENEFCAKIYSLIKKCIVDATKL